MLIAACVKQVPSPESAAGLDPMTLRLRRDGAFVLDEPDGHGVELALHLGEQSGAEVTLVSMAPDGATGGLVGALAMGASSAVVVSDPALEGADSLSTAKVLAAVVRRLGVDLLVAATESSDGYSGTVPVQVAGLLDWPALTYLTEASISGTTLRASRQTDAGVEEVECELPAVVSVTASAAEPRYPTLRNIMAARGRSVEQLALADLGLSPGFTGGGAARQQLLRLEDAPPRAAGEVIVDEGDAEDVILRALGEWQII